MSASKNNDKTPRKLPSLARPATPSIPGRRAVTENGSPLPKSRAEGLSGLAISQSRSATPVGRRAASDSQPPATPPSRKNSQPNKDIANSSPLLSTPSTARKIQPSKGNSNSKPFPATPSSGKRTQTNRDITSSDEKRNIEAQPPAKKQDQKYKEHIHVGHLLASADIKVVANTDADNKQLFMTTLRDNERVQLVHVDFLTAISQHFGCGKKKKDCILEYMAAQHKKRSTGSAATKTPRDLQVNTQANLSKSIAPELDSPLPSPLPHQDIHVGSTHGDYKVYAYLKRGTVSFRLHRDELISFKGAIKEKLAVPKMKVDYKDIVFEPAYQGDSLELVKAAVEAGMQGRDTAGTLGFRSEKSPVIILGQEEDEELSKALQNIQNAQQVLGIEVKKSETALQQRHLKLTEREQSVHEKEECLKKRESEIEELQQTGKPKVSFAIPKETAAQEPVALRTQENVLETGTSSNESLAHFCTKCDMFEKISMDAAATFDGKNAKIQELQDTLKEKLAEINNLTSQLEAAKDLSLLPLRINTVGNTFDSAFERIPDDQPNAGMFLDKTRAFVRGKDQHKDREFSRYRIVHQLPTVQVDGELIECGHEYLGTKYSVYKKGELIKLVQEPEAGMMKQEGDQAVISWTCFIETVAITDKL